MRIIAGLRRGGRLYTGKAPGLRPTSDRVREAIFSILGERVVGERVLDLYAGSGAFGYEALSRGASEAFFVERNRRLGRWIERSGRELRFDGRYGVHIGDVGSFLSRKERAESFGLVFVDPPYREGLVTATLERLNALGGERLVVLEREKREEPEITLPSWSRLRMYGDTVVEFLLAGLRRA